MDEALLRDIRKKDDDLQVVSDNVIITTLNIGEPIPEPIGPEPLVFPKIDINIQIVRHMFAVLAGTFFFYALFGLVPYHLIQSNWVVNVSLTGSSGFTCFVFYILMYAARNNYHWGLAGLTFWVLSTYVLIFSVAALIHDLILFQACTISLSNALGASSLHWPHRTRQWIRGGQHLPWLPVGCRFGWLGFMPLSKSSAGYNRVCSLSLPSLDSPSMRRTRST